MRTGEEEMTMDEGSVISAEKAQDAIACTVDLFAEKGLTVAESIHVLRCLTEAFGIMWPDDERER